MLVNSRLGENLKRLNTAGLALAKIKLEVCNHPLIIMAKEKKADLLQHPVCLVITERKWDMYGLKAYSLLIGVYVIFLAAFNTFILTSASPIDSPEKFNCTEFFSSTQKNQTRNEANIEDKPKTQKEILNQGISIEENLRRGCISPHLPAQVRSNIPCLRVPLSTRLALAILPMMSSSS